MNTPWFDDAVKAIRGEAAKVPFPGDQDPIAVVLDRFANKLFSECANGGAIGADQCPTCRAYRTEQAEQAEASLQIMAKGLTAKLRDLDVTLDHAEAEKVALADALDEAHAALSGLSDVTDHATQVAAKATQDAAHEREERGSAQRQADAAQAAMIAAASAQADAERRIKAIQALAAKITEVK